MGGGGRLLLERAQRLERRPSARYPLREGGGAADGLLLRRSGRVERGARRGKLRALLSGKLPRGAKQLLLAGGNGGAVRLLLLFAALELPVGRQQLRERKIAAFLGQGGTEILLGLLFFGARARESGLRRLKRRPSGGETRLARGVVGARFLEGGAA